MKKIIVLFGSLLLSINSFTSAIDLSERVDSIEQTLQGYVDVISRPFTFFWDLISGVWYGISTIFVKSITIFSSISGLSFFSYNLSNISYLTGLLGVDISTLFFGLFSIILFLVILRFVYRLIPFFHSK